jgi:hypothetical protein
MKLGYMKLMKFQRPSINYMLELFFFKGGKIGCLNYLSVDATLCHTHSLFDALRKHPVETTSQLRGFRGDPWDTGRGLKDRTWTIHSLHGSMCSSQRVTDISCQLSALIHHCTQSLFLRKDDAGLWYMLVCFHKSMNLPDQM